MIHRLALAVALVLSLTGCGSVKDYVAPTKANLLDPLPGKALVYLFRSPDDRLVIDVAVDGIKVATLGPEQHTALSLDPGAHLVTTRSPSTRPQDQLPPFSLSVLTGKRYFLALPAPEIRTETGIVGFMPIGKLAMPIPGSLIRETGAPRAWIEVREDESHWFIFYSKPVAPAAGAL